jgi:autotransporter-associated beta strand protein
MQNFDTVNGQEYTLTFSLGLYVDNWGSKDMSFIASIVDTTYVDTAYYLGGQNQTLASITGAAGSIIGLQQDASTATARTLTLNNTTPQTIASTLIGTGGFVVAGTSGVTLSGANTYTGTTRINSGTLTITGSIDSSSNIVNNAALVFNQSANDTYSHIISGTGSLTQDGSAVLTLSGANTYSGGTTIHSGTLNISSASNIGSGSLTLSGGVLQANDALTLSQAITLTANSTIDTMGHAVELSGIISGGYGLTIIDSTNGTTGTIRLNVLSTFTGRTVIGSGVTLLGAIPEFSSSAPFFDVDAGFKITQTGQISGEGAFIKKGKGIYELANTGTGLDANSWTGDTIIEDGVLQIDHSSELPTGKTVFFDAVTVGENPVLRAGESMTISNNVNLMTDGTIDTNGYNVTESGTLSGTHDFHKIGNGDLNLTGDNSNKVQGEIIVDGGSLTVATADNLGQPDAVNLKSGSLHVKGTFTSTVPIRLGGTAPTPG